MTFILNPNNAIFRKNTITELKTYQFKTNINCENSIRTLMLFIEASPDIKSWSVDTSSIDNLLSVQSSNLSSEEIISIVEKAGFKIEELVKL